MTVEQIVRVTGRGYIVCGKDLTIKYGDKVSVNGKTFEVTGVERMIKPMTTPILSENCGLILRPNNEVKEIIKIDDIITKID